MLAALRTEYSEKTATDDLLYEALNCEIDLSEVLLSRAPDFHSQDDLLIDKLTDVDLSLQVLAIERGIRPSETKYAQLFVSAPSFAKLVIARDLHQQRFESFAKCDSELSVEQDPHRLEMKLACAILLSTEREAERLMDVLVRHSGPNSRLASRLHCWTDLSNQTFKGPYERAYAVAHAANGLLAVMRPLRSIASVKMLRELLSEFQSAACLNHAVCARFVRDIESFVREMAEEFLSMDWMRAYGHVLRRFSQTELNIWRLPPFDEKLMNLGTPMTEPKVLVNSGKQLAAAYSDRRTWLRYWLEILPTCDEAQMLSVLDGWFRRADAGCNSAPEGWPIFELKCSPAEIPVVQLPEEVSTAPEIVFPPMTAQEENARRNHAWAMGRF
jgi:hypothetical protein